MGFQHLFLEQEVDSVPDNQCYKPYEDLCVQCLIALATHCPVSKEGFIFPEQFFGCIPAFIKVKGIRCAHCADTLEAQLCRQHNNANMMAIGAGFTGPKLAAAMVETFLSTAFEGGRHARRVALMDAIEG